MKKQIILIFGGKSSEYEVSLLSMYNVSSAIDKNKYDVKKIGITKLGVWYYYTGSDEDIKNDTWCSKKDGLYALSLIPNGGFTYEKDGELVNFGCDATVIPVVHGSYCEDGRLQGLLDMCGLKYVGPGTASSAVCMDKYITKLIINYRNIPQAGFILAHRGKYNTAPEELVSQTEAEFSYPVFVKPANAGSSVGASKVRNREELLPAVFQALQYDSKALIEEYINGREVEVAVMGNEEPFASLPGEICPNSEFYDYETKYHSDVATYHIPAELSQEKTEQIRSYAIKIYKALDCRGLARVDFFVTPDRIVFNEINTLPGFTSISMYPSLMMNYGMTYPEIIDKLIEYAGEQ